MRPLLFLGQGMPPIADLLCANLVLTPTLLTPAACVDSGPGGVRVLQHDMVHSRSILAEVSVQASVDQVLLCVNPSNRRERCCRGFVCIMLCCLACFLL